MNYRINKGREGGGEGGRREGGKEGREETRGGTGRGRTKGSNHLDVDGRPPYGTNEVGCTHPCLKLIVLQCPAGL